MTTACEILDEIRREIRDGLAPCDSPGIDWVVCPPCYDHLAEHFKGDPGPPWDEGVGLTGNKEECILEGTGCVVCEMSHRAILGTPTTNRFPGESSAPDNPCDSDFMEDIST